MADSYYQVSAVIISSFTSYVCIFELTSSTFMLYVGALF